METIIPFGGSFLWIYIYEDGALNINVDSEKSKMEFSICPPIVQEK